MRRLLLLISLVAIFILPGALQAQNNWTCDGGPNDILNAAEAAQNNGDLQKALGLAKLALDICKDNPVRQGQAQLLVIDIQQQLLPTRTAEPESVIFPDLKGIYHVGRVYYNWIDSSRRETLAPDKSAKRDLVVEVWYPGLVANYESPGPYTEEDWWNAVYKDFPGLNRYIRVHASLTAPVAPRLGGHTLLNVTMIPEKRNFPVLIFDPGLQDVPFNYTSIIEELASHGYVVVGMTHPYSSAAVEYLDRRIVLASAAGQEVNASLLNIWSCDVSFVLDQLEQLNKPDSQDRFRGSLDLTSVGMIGNSFGGVNTIQSAYLDKRIKAAISLDGTADDLVSKIDLQIPFMVVGGEGAGRFFRSHLHGDKYLLSIADVGHHNYGDWGLLSPLIPNPQNLGPLDPYLAISIINDYSEAFFDRYLRTGSAWPTYDEAVFTSFLTPG